MFEKYFGNKNDGKEDPEAARKITSQRIKDAGDRKMSPDELGLVKDPDSDMMVTPEELKEKRDNEDRNNT